LSLGFGLATSPVPLPAAPPAAAPIAAPAGQTRIASYRARGWDAKESEHQPELLRESHKLYRSAL